MTPLSSRGTLNLTTMKRPSTVIAALGFGALGVALVFLAIQFDRGLSAQTIGPITPPAGDWTSIRQGGQSKPPISWTPESVTVTLAPGETKTVHVTAAIESPIPATVTSVVPSLAPYLMVQPTSAPPTVTGGQLGFDLNFSIPVGTPFQTIDGTIHLRSATEVTRLQLRNARPQRLDGRDRDATSTARSESTSFTVARPLSIALSISPRVDIDGVTFQYPADWRVQRSPGSASEIPVAAVTSPAGSRIVVLPRGGFAYGIDPESMTSESHILVDDKPAFRTDYADSGGTVFLVRISFDPPLGDFPEFHLEMRPVAADQEAEVGLARVLETLRVQ